MTDDAVRAWWVYGAPCVGKSVTAWNLYADLLRGRPRAYFDVDQLGICYPGPHDDVERSELKARASAVLVEHLVRAGARTVVVSGVLDPGSHAQVAAALEGVEVTFCRLRADADVLRPRLEARYEPEDVERALAGAAQWDELDAGHAVVDSSDEVDAVAQRVVRALRESAPTVATAGAASPGAAAAAAATTLPPRAVFVCGTRGVGKSAVAFGLTMQAWSSGRTCAFLDLQQIGFLDGVDGVDGRGAAAASVTAPLVRDLWEVFAASGAVDLVLSGDLSSVEEAGSYRDALGPESLLVVRLRAGQGELRRRIAARARGEAGPELAGDDLRGLDAAAVESAATAAFAAQEQDDAGEVADVVLPTDGVEPSELVEQVVQLREERFPAPAAPAAPPLV